MNQQLERGLCFVFDKRTVDKLFSSVTSYQTSFDTRFEKHNKVVYCILLAKVLKCKSECSSKEKPGEFSIAVLNSSWRHTSRQKHVTIHTHTSSRILLLVSPLSNTFIQMVVATTTVGKPAENTKYTAEYH